jgi:predicted NBD/HSP70 family sugar kinase
VHADLAPGFVPAALWTRAYRALAEATPGHRTLTFTLFQTDEPACTYSSPLLPADHPDAARSLRHAERLLKFLLWQRGASRVFVSGANEIAAALGAIYAPGGARAFDAEFMGGKVYGRPFTIEAGGVPPASSSPLSGYSIGRHLEGCRIGFDLGGSDRKVAALIDGEVVYSEEIPWDPYFQSDPSYHLEGVHDSLKRAAAHLPRVDAIGGSAAGVYVDNEVRVASLFRGVSAQNFEDHIRRMFFTLQERWGGVPFVVVNDGEVTALAGAMSIGDDAVLGISMGTSQAGGYVTPEGSLTPWLNELAFAPVDYADDAPVDEWSGDAGCGVQYFSQQGVARLASSAGLAFPEGQPLAERLVAVQEAFAAGDTAAVGVFDAIGTAFGYSLAHYADFYDLRHVLVLGRVTSGPSGEHLLRRARETLGTEFPDLAARLDIRLPDEKSRRHGQAVAAASLPALAKR